MALALEDIADRLVLAGVWRPVAPSNVSAAYNGGVLAQGMVAITLPDGREGFVVSGRATPPGTDSESPIVPVSVCILAFDEHGRLHVETPRYIGDPTHNGTSEAAVGDFNGDGIDDIFLAAENEEPNRASASTVFLSNAQGGYTKMVLADLSMAHDVQVAGFGDRTLLLVGTMQTLYPPQPDLINPVYAWDGTGFTRTEVMPGFTWVGGAVSLADITGDGNAEYIVGDFFMGPGFPWTPDHNMNVAVYPLDPWSLRVTGDSPLWIGTPYFNKPEYAHYQALAGGTTLPSHVYRVWTDDFNNDGHVDILAGVSIFTVNGIEKNMLQMFRSDGAGGFTDVSDASNPEFDQDTNELDYTMQLLDIDGSGIDSYLSGTELRLDQPSRNANWVLLNDGTGRLRVALHDEFVPMGEAICAWVERTTGAVPYATEFHPCVDGDGLLQFVAKVGVNTFASGYPVTHYVFVAVEADWDVRTQFADPIAIEDRNGSTRMRTFAGDDVIADVNHAESASIDAGIGIDTATYGHARDDYTVAAVADAFVVQGHGLRDTLVNVERLRFADGALALDLPGNAGIVAKTLGAVFGAGSVHDRTYARIGLELTDAGMDAAVLMQLALSVRLGAASSDSAAVVDLLYTNLVGHAPSADDLAYYTRLIDDGVFTIPTLALFAADTSYNLLNIDFVGLQANGLPFG